MDLAAQRVGDEAHHVAEPLQARHLTPQHQVADEHGVLAVLFRAPTLGQALRPPQRDVRRPEAGILGVGAAQLRQLEEVNQLVPNRVPEVLVAAVERQCDAPLQELREAGDPLREEIRGDVRLLEVLMRRVDDQRYAPERAVAEQRREGVEALLGVAQRQLRQRLLLRIIVDIHVGSGEDVPIEIGVLDFVLAEGNVLRHEWGRRR